MSLGFVLPDPGLCAWQLYVSWHLLSLASGRAVFEWEVSGREERQGARVVWYARAAAGTGREHIGERASTGAVPTREGEL